MLIANEERGEFAVTVAGNEIVVAATMRGLAAMSNRLGTKGLGDLLVLIVSAEPNAMLAGVECLTVQGDGAAAANAMTLADVGDIRDALKKALEAASGGRKGNAGAAGETP